MGAEANAVTDHSNRLLTRLLLGDDVLFPKLMKGDKENPGLSFANLWAEVCDIMDAN
jgi:hypothetical protein